LNGVMHVQVAFLYRGRYMSLAQRISGLQMAHEHPNAPREVSFEYLNQQLVWGELQNFVAFLLPLLTPRAIAGTPLLAHALAAITRIRRWQGAQTCGLKKHLLHRRKVEGHDLQ
jgi:hypothetical protein